ncbi:rust resistance kinase Lr10 [Trifolium repens]|nr:rust resistance kinase Lr10 [Trifolium repens]
MNTVLQSYYSSIKCLSSHGYQVYALNSTLKIKDVTLTYCTKLYDMSFVPKDVVFSIGVDLVLGWDTSCSNGSKTEHDCYNIVNESNGGRKKEQILEQGDDLSEHIEVEKYAKIAKKLAIVGLWCIQWHPVDRPSMQVVVHMLEGDGEKLSMPPNPFASADPAIMNVSLIGRHLHRE